MKQSLINKRNNRRAIRTRTKIKGVGNGVRLSVFRSNTNVYAQIIDDATGKTLVSASSLETKTKGKKTDASKNVGKTIAEKALKAGIKKVVFDKGKYKYHGRIKAVAEGAREAGLSL